MSALRGRHRLSATTGQMRPLPEQMRPLPEWSCPAAAIGLAVLVAGADFWLKTWLVALMGEKGGFLELAPFLNLVMVWNTGVAFGLFSQDTASVRDALALGGIALAVCLVLLVWIFRTGNCMLALAGGAVTGGGAGNAIDRWRFGAVADFLDFHLYDWHWPAFNLADMAISAGAVVILLGGLGGQTHGNRGDNSDGPA